MTTQELMECSNETLADWWADIQDELDRRDLKFEVVKMHPGNANADKPTPLLVRVLTNVGSLPPSDLAKLDTLMKSWANP